MVRDIANSFRPRNYTELEEYVQCGLYGLLRAIRKHESDKGKLTTIAFDAIRWEILRYIKRERKHKYAPLHEVSYETASAFSDILPNSLTTIERDIFSLRNQGHTFKEIGNKTGKSRAAIYRLFHKAIKKVQSV